MRRKKKHIRIDRYSICLAACKAAYIEGASFTSAALAARLKMPCNRHFQETMNDLARAGVLDVARLLCDDGHYRKYFYAQKTQPMFDLTGKENVA